MLRSVADDFQVEELGEPPAEPGGEHLLLLVEKRGTNSAWVARELARLAGVSEVDVGYRGLKDRHALTRQWFSVRTPLDQPERFSGCGFRTLQARRSRTKLRRGEHGGNRFQLRLRHLRGDVSALEARARQLAEHGVPNYFGPQRFGRNDANLARARRWVAGARLPRGGQRGFVLSTARALLFNEVLAARVLAARTHTAGGVTAAHPISAVHGDVWVDGQVCGPLWGRGYNPARGQARMIEQRALAAHGAWCAALERANVELDYRPFTCHPAAISTRCADGCAEISFDLPAGAYATAVLRELFGCVTETAAPGDRP